MNNKFTITFEDTIGSLYKASVNLLLEPYYLAESEILPIFFDEVGYVKNTEIMRDFIFRASIKADELFYGKLTYLDPKELLYLKKNLTECLVLNMFAKKLAKDIAISKSRSKSFGDFNVSTSIKNDPMFVENLVTSSQACIDEAKATILTNDEIMLNVGLSNVKGSLNPNQTLVSRLWAHNELGYSSHSIFANTKVEYNGKLYKDGLIGRYNVPRA